MSEVTSPVSRVSFLKEPQLYQLSDFANAIYQHKYAMTKEDGSKETWPETAFRVTKNVLGALGHTEDDYEFQQVYRLIKERKFIPGGRYLYAAGRDLHQTNNCFLLRAEDTREGWAKLLEKCALILQTGGGVGVEYSNIRELGAPIKRTGGVASGPLSLMQMVNEIGRGVMQGGSRRSAIIALLRWDHPDCMDFIHLKDWLPEVHALKEKDFNFPATMDMTNISVQLNDEFFEAFNNIYHEKHELAHTIYHETVKNMLKTGEPGFRVNIGENSAEDLTNPCGEITSEDDSDVCCLGSINFGKIDDIEELYTAVEFGTLFLLAGTVYSDLPYSEVEEVRQRNRRIGLGVMGLHEWLLKRGKSYGPDEELGEWLEVYMTSDDHAHFYATMHNLSTPVKTRAIAPTGTIAIIGETTTGIEPIFCTAYKRRFLKDHAWHYQYVIDPTAKRIIEQGVEPKDIEDAYQLSLDVERRIEFQAWLQRYVDHAISSTVNLPYPIEDIKEINRFSSMLYKHLPKLRGLTAYPNGARGGQPLTAVPYSVAIKQEGVTFEEETERCVGGSCGV